MATFVSNWLDNVAYNRLGNKNQSFVSSSQLLRLYNNFDVSKPKWNALKTPQDFENAVRFNPVVNACVSILANAASNAKKVAIDITTGEEIPWTENDPAIKKLYQLFVERPNVLQSHQQFEREGVFFRKAFGNRFVYQNFALGVKPEIDLLDIMALWNLPSQHIDIKTTGKIYDQIELSGIISEYALTNQNPIKKYDPNEIILFNEVNISNKLSSVIGISPLESLQQPITNLQLAFEAMNTILQSRGMSGIISPEKKDGMGGSMSVTPDEKKELDQEFKEKYGLRDGQSPYMFSPFPLKYIKTLMNSTELGIYKEYSNNAILISNGLGVPPELAKTWIEGTTYENQVQSVKRLYQDTTIPAVKDDDAYWSSRLNTRKYGIVLQSKWDHIPALQTAFKEKSLALNLDSRTAESAFNNNIITQNQYLEMIGLPTIEGGDTYKTTKDED